MCQCARVTFFFHENTTVPVNPVVNFDDKQLNNSIKKIVTVSTAGMVIDLVYVSERIEIRSETSSEMSKSIPI